LATSAQVPANRERMNTIQSIQLGERDRDSVHYQQDRVTMMRVYSNSGFGYAANAGHDVHYFRCA